MSKQVRPKIMISRQLAEKLSAEPCARMMLEVGAQEDGFRQLMLGEQVRLDDQYGRICTWESEAGFIHLAVWWNDTTHATVYRYKHVVSETSSIWRRRDSGSTSKPKHEFCIMLRAIHDFYEKHGEKLPCWPDPDNPPKTRYLARYKHQTATGEDFQYFRNKMIAILGVPKEFLRPSQPEGYETDVADAVVAAVSMTANAGPKCHHLRCHKSDSHVLPRVMRDPYRIHRIELEKEGREIPPLYCQIKEHQRELEARENGRHLIVPVEVQSPYDWEGVDEDHSVADGPPQSAWHKLFEAMGNPR